MFESFRLFVLSFLYYFGFTYAAFTALKQRTTSVEVAGPSELSPTGQAPHSRTKVLLGTPALKLMIMVTTLAMLSLVGAEWFPLFAEMRVIFMYTLLFSPPFTQQEVYSQVFSPLLVRGGTFALSLQTSNFFSRKVPLFVVRRCISLGIAAMNYTQRHHALDEDAVRDILSGLVFSQRALQQVADLSRESDGATYTAIAQDSNFAVGALTSRVKRALLNEDEQAELFDARAPTHGRVVSEREARHPQSVPVAIATAVSASASTSASTSIAAAAAPRRPDGQVESLRSERTYSASDEGSIIAAERPHRDKRKKKKFFGWF